MLRHPAVFIVEIVDAQVVGVGGFGVLAFFRFEVAVEGHAGAGGDEAAEDDVLLEAAEVVDPAFQGRFGEDAGGFLEGGGGDEGLAGEGGLGDA